MRPLLILAFFSVSLQATVPSVAGWFTIASATDSIIGEPVAKMLKKAATKVKTKFHRKHLPDCLDVIGNKPCVVKGKR